MNTIAVAPPTREIVLSRILAAPRELVWSAWTEPQHIVHWWGPEGFTLTNQEMDVRPGGVWRHVLHGPDGTPYPNRCVFCEVDKPDRIAFTHAGGREGGPGIQSMVAWTFVALNANHTLVTVQMAYPSAEHRDQVVKDGNAIEGGDRTLSRLGRYLARLAAEHDAGTDNCEFTITRLFAASSEALWQAWTDPRHFARWWGPGSFTNPICTMDVRPGGPYRIVMRSPDGTDYPLKGFYRTVAPPVRLVMKMDCSEHPEGWQDLVDPHRQGNPNPVGELLTTVLFEPRLHETKLTVRIRFETTEIRAAMMKMGMLECWSESLDRLADVSRSLVTPAAAAKPAHSTPSAHA